MSSNEELQKVDGKLSQSQRKKMAKASLELGVGAISKVAEYTAEGMKSPKVAEAAKEISKQLGESNKLAKVGAGLVTLGATGGAGTAVGGTAIGAALATAAPVVAVVGVSALAVFGLVKVAEKIQGDE